jgi:N utilization substance protein A
MEVVVPEDQISLTIGKRGQNIRLAGILVGWELDVKSEEAKKQEILAAMSSMMGEAEGVEEPEEEDAEQISAEAADDTADIDQDGAYDADTEEVSQIPEEVMTALAERGLETPEAVAAASDEELNDVPGMNPEILAGLRAWAEGEPDEGEE